MSIATRLYRDSYTNNGGICTLEWQMPTKTDNIERIGIIPWIYKYYADEGSYSWTLKYMYLQYYDGSSWVDIYRDESVSASSGDDSNEIHMDIGKDSWTSEEYNNFGETYQGKKIRFGNASEYYSFSEEDGSWYLQQLIRYKQPTITEPTFSRDFANSCVNINTVISCYDGYTISLNGQTFTNTKSIPESAFVLGNNTITISVYNGDMSANKVVSYSFINYNPTASNMSFTNSTLDNDTTVEVTATNAQMYEMYVNGVLKYTSNTQVFIPPKSSFIVGENACFVRCYNTTSMRYVDTSVFKKTMSLLQPTISNVNIISDNNLIDETTTLTWQSNYQDAFNVYINDVKIKSLSGSIKATDLPIGTLKVGSNKIKIEIVKNAINGIANSGITVYYETNKNFTRIMPTISNVSLSGNNRDNVNKVTWASTNATNYNVFINGKPNTTSNTFYDIQEGILIIGNNKIEVEAIRTTAFDTISVKQEIRVDIIQNTPFVYSLEPHNLNINIENQSNVSFSTSEFCHRWEYFINNKPYSQGTSDQVIPVPKNIFTKGTNTHKIKIYYSPAYNSSDIRVAERVSTFTGYGKPQSVELDSTAVYNNATPTITWQTGTNDSDNQTAFEIEIVDGETSTIIEEKVVVSTAKSYTIESSLSNNKEYIIRVSIKNKYDIWSDWSAKEIITNFNNLESPGLIISSNINGVTFKIDVIQPENFKEIRIYRKDDINENWICIASNLNTDEIMTDYVPQPSTNNYYKARMYDLDGGYSESLTYKINYKLDHYVLTDVQALENSIALVGAISNLQPIQNIVSKVFARNRAPKIYLDDTYYVSGTINYTCDIDTLHKLEKLINKGKIYCYRDWRGKKLYCFITIGSTTYAEARLNNVVLNLTEVNFSEENMYTGSGYKKIIYLNGTYFLDGTVDLSGYDLGANREVVYDVTY